MMTAPNLAQYDRIVVAFSGGKDSMACVLRLLECGADPARIELWHHEIDGREFAKLRMDWPVTRDYCRKIAEALGLQIYFSWKVGGFEGEMMRENTRTAPAKYETPGGLVGQGGGERGKLGTRRKFPQVSADLSVRWCSGYLKIDVADKAITGQARFYTGKSLFVTGERAQESANRERYATFEPHRTDNRHGKLRPRWVDHWRPVHGWSEAQVWEIIKQFRVNPHPAYHLGWGRLSCMTCIFGSANQWASVQAVAPVMFDLVALREQEFGSTIHRSESVGERAARGTPYAATMRDDLVRMAMGEEYTAPAILPPGEEWVLPAGAFGEKDGPC